MGVPRGEGPDGPFFQDRGSMSFHGGVWAEELGSGSVSRPGAGQDPEVI